MAEKSIALVTGGNRGIGLEVCRQLGSAGHFVWLTARGEARGREAAEALRGEGHDVDFLQLDVTNDDDVERVHDAVMERSGRLDVLVNNAGILIDRGWPVSDENRAEASVFRTDLATLSTTMDVNAFGAFRLCKRFLPGMLERGHGRVVNVSSALGQMDGMEAGWAAYRISKVAMNAVTLAFAAETTGADVLVNSASPGWVRTDMGGPDASLSVEEGADTIVWLATHPPGGPNGGFFRAREPLAW